LLRALWVPGPGAATGLQVAVRELRIPLSPGGLFGLSVAGFDPRVPRLRKVSAVSHQPGTKDAKD